MRGLTIMRPLPVAQFLNVYGNGQNYLLTPDPKEVWDTGSTGLGSLNIDFGAVVEFDTVFLGFTTAAAAATWRLVKTDGVAAELLPTTALRVPGSTGPRYHGLAKLGAPVASQTLRLTLDQPGTSGAMQAGVLMVGKRFEHPYEFKSGRKPIDLSERVDLASGGFGFGRGAIKSSFRFTFSDLDDADLETLWNEIMAVGSSNPVLLVEGGEGAVTHNQVHYGVFERFEPYERDDPADTRWALSMTDWV